MNRKIAQLEGQLYQFHQANCQLDEYNKELKSYCADLVQQKIELQIQFDELKNNVKLIENEKESLQERINDDQLQLRQQYEQRFEQQSKYYIFHYNSLLANYQQLDSSKTHIEQQLLHRQAIVYSQPMPSTGVLRLDMSRQETFETMFFKLAKQIKNPISLPDLQCKLNDGDDISTYYNQFIPYINEEIRESICEEIDSIQKSGKFGFEVKIENFIHNNNIGISIMTCVCERNSVPRLDHGFFKEAIGIQIRSKQSISILIAIGKEENTDKPKATISITIPTTDVSNNYKIGDCIIIHCLGGLIPTERMWNACIQPSRVSFQNQFVYGQLQPWPSEEIIILPDDDISFAALNHTQRGAVNMLKLNPSGLFLIQGPPGTGKTTTIVEIIRSLLTNPQSSSINKLLVCTPANKPLQDLVKQSKNKMHRVVHMALIGVRKDVDTSLKDVFVNDYGKQFVDIFNQHINCLGKKQSHSFCETSILLLIKRDINSIINKIQQLLSEPRNLNPTRDVILTVEAAITSLTNLEQDCGHDNIDVSQLILIIERYLGVLKAAKFEEFLLQRAEIVFSTLTSSGRPWLKKIIPNFDLVIVDEAAQALIPEIFIPMKFNPSMMILVGDPQQLPPLVKSKSAGERGYSNSLMSWLMHDCEQGEYLMLTEQYRMHEDICRWPSYRNYEQRLTTSHSIRLRPSILNTNTLLHNELKIPNLLIDIKGNENRQQPSISNIDEAKIVVDTLCYLLRCDFKPQQIGIITFYIEQVDTIKDIIYHLPTNIKNSIKPVLISTVDGFQGGERDIILISAVRTCKSVGFLAKPNRINVAMTRAKHARWVFCNKSSLSESNCDLASFVTDTDCLKFIDQKGFRNMIEDPLTSK